MNCLYLEPSSPKLDLPLSYVEDSNCSLFIYFYFNGVTVVILFQPSVRSYTMWGCPTMLQDGHSRWAFTDASSSTYTNGLPNNFITLKLMKDPTSINNQFFLKSPHTLMSSWYDKYRPLTVKDETQLEWCFCSYLLFIEGIGVDTALRWVCPCTRQNKERIFFVENCNRNAHEDTRDNKQR